MPMCNVNRQLQYSVLGKGHTSDCGEPWIIPPADMAVVHEPMKLPLREQGIDKIETAADKRVST